MTAPQIPGDRAEAIRALENIYAANPLDMHTLAALSFRLAEDGRDLEALCHTQRAVEAHPDCHEAWLNLGYALTAAGRQEEAFQAYGRALAIPTSTPSALTARGQAQLILRQDAEALDSFERALGAQPALAAAQLGQGRALLRLGRYEATLAYIDQLLIREPNFLALRLLRAQTLLTQGRSADALRALEALPGSDTTSSFGSLIRGLALLEQGNPSGALVALDLALDHDPVLALAYLGRGRALAALNRVTAAIDAFARAARFDPNNAAPHVRIGHARITLQQLEEAITAFTDALYRQPSDTRALQGRAQCLAALDRAPEALQDYNHLLQIAPHADYMLGERFHVQMHCCDWQDFEVRRAQIALRVRQGERADSPGSFITHSTSPADQLICARTFASDHLPAQSSTLPRIQMSASHRLRVAYLSADFHQHATAFLAAGLFEQHDRSRFEIFALSFGPDDSSDMRRRLERAFERFIDVRASSDQQIAARARELEIQIAVDAKGYTLGGRPAIFAHRAAPVQVSFLAYPGTLGVDFMDYIVADRHVIPEGERAHYSEQVIYLPDSYQVNDSRRVVAANPSRQEAGLPAHGVVFCCFNSQYKITPALFDAWMRILRATPESVLWLLGSNPVAVGNLSREAMRRDIDPKRLIFAPRTDPARHLARCGLADLFLDTFPYNAHTTASDSLWGGVPVITLAGSSFPSRVATSLLHAVGLGQLSVTHIDDYVETAVQLARKPQALADLKSHLQRTRHTAPLFDTARYCRSLEAAYTAVWDRYVRGERPSALALASGSPC